MFSLNEINRFYLHTRPMDLRKGFNMLCGVIRSQLLKTEDIHPLKTGISVHFSNSLV